MRCLLSLSLVTCIAGCTSSSSSSLPPGGCLDAYGFAHIAVDAEAGHDAFELCGLCSDAGAVAQGCPASLGCGYDHDAGEIVCSYGPPTE